MKNNRFRKVFIYVLILFVILKSAYCGNNEVLQTNPHEPEADLGIYEIDVTSYKPLSTKDIIFDNLKSTYILFDGGSGSYKQNDKVGGRILLGTQIVTVGFGAATIISSAYYLSSMLNEHFEMQNTPEELKEELSKKYTSQQEQSILQMKIFGLITVGCFLTETVTSICRPLFYEKELITGAFNEKRKVNLLVYPIIAPNQLTIKIKFRG